MVIKVSHGARKKELIHVIFEFRETELRSHSKGLEENTINTEVTL